MESFMQIPDEGAYSRYNQYGDNPMAPVGPIALVPLKGSVEFTDKVNWYLNKRRSEYQEQEFISKYPGFYRQDYRIAVENARFSSGEGKAVIQSSVRGHEDVRSDEPHEPGRSLPGSEACYSRLLR